MAYSIKTMSHLTHDLGTAFPGKASIQDTISVPFSPQDLTKAITQVASENIDSNKPMTQVEYYSIRINSSIALSRTQVEKAGMVSFHVFVF